MITTVNQVSSAWFDNRLVRKSLNKETNFNKCEWIPTVTLATTGWGGATSTWRKKQAISFSRGDGQRLFLTLLKVWEWVPWKRSESFWSTFIIMMVSYHMRNSFSCTMKSSWALCCSKVIVRRSTEPICDLRTAKFSHASQFLRLVIEPTQLWAWSGRAHLQELLLASWISWSSVHSIFTKIRTNY